MSILSTWLYSGEFRGGLIWGNGLLHYSDSTQDTERYFPDSKFSKEGRAKESINEARTIVAYVTKLYDKADYDGVGVHIQESTNNQ